MNKCTKCILPSTYPGISFDQMGICNYCLNYKEFNPLGVEKLLEIVMKKKSNSKYDAIVTLSGGRDSTYTLWYCVKKLKLNILALTIDNGFMPDHTWSNIQNAVSILEVDHIIAKHNYLIKSFKPVLLSFLKKPSPPMISILCLGCRLGYVKELWKNAKKNRIPLMISGGGEPETSFATAFFTNSKNKIIKIFSFFYGFAKEFAKNFNYLKNINIPYMMMREYYYSFFPFNISKKIIYPELEYPSLFSYIQWNENEIMETIVGELGWQKYKYSEAPWRSDCKINLLKNYFYYNLLGFSKNDELASNLIRKNLLTREEAIPRVSKENIFPKEYFEKFAKDLNLYPEVFEVF